jgi:hypothetical protein
MRDRDSLLYKPGLIAPSASHGDERGCATRRLHVKRTDMSHRSTPAIPERQKQLLALLDAFGGRACRIDFQKLLFLYCQEHSETATYEFVPYKFGAFSFTSYADRRKMVERGLLADDEQTWELTHEGRREANAAPAVGLLLSTFVRRYRQLSGDALVAETYRQHPYYATRSEIAERILRDDAKTLQQIKDARRIYETVPLATIGYEGRTLESYLNDLLRSGLTVLCDVRRNPLSRKYGFSKATLSKACEGVGIRYEHAPELGIASEQRRNLETQADYDALFAEYEREALPHQGSAIARIGKWVRSGERVALTCYERLPHQCHRHCVAKAVESDFAGKIASKHL